MISNRQNPVEWAMLLTELDEAREHLESLIDSMNAADGYDDEDFAVELGHIFAHLNRAWNSRAHVGDIPDETSSRYTQFPTDLYPVG